MKVVRGAGSAPRVKLAVWRRRTALIAGIGLLMAASTGTTAQAAERHVLDPVLSLTGGTATSSIDPVPDPGSVHPEKTFNDPCGVATDTYGDLYVANGATSTVHQVEGESRFEGRIDVFSPSGEFLTEIADEFWPCSLAVDSTGRLFVRREATETVVRYDPSTYEPSAGKVAYSAIPTQIATNVLGLAIDRADDRLFVAKALTGGKYSIEVLRPDGSVEETFFEGEFGPPRGLDVWAQSGNLLASGAASNEQPNDARAFVIGGASHAIEVTLEGTPTQKFGFGFGLAGVAVDQSNGDLYVGDTVIHHAADQFDSAGNFIGQIALGTNGLIRSEPFSEVAVDQGENSPNKGYVYVTSGFQASNSHLYAFAPVALESPAVRGERAEDVGPSEAVLAAEINPHGFETTYRFEYGFANCASNPCQSTPLPAASAGAGGAFQPVSVPVTGLVPGATYHFRLVATSHCDPGEPAAECTTEGPGGTFSTFPSPPAQNCPNADRRTGFSARLPDCRAYELVTPPNTNGRVPTATVFGEESYSMPVLLASPDGESLAFGTEGGAIPQLGGGGFHDTYLSVRGPGGWNSHFTGLDGSQAQEPDPTGQSSDYSYSFWFVRGDKGSLATSAGASYLRGPAGQIEPVGVGGLDTDLGARDRWISPGGAHVIFTSDEGSLEAGGPPAGVEGIYDRSPGGPTRVISLLPHDVSLTAGETLSYLGASADGSAVAFKVAGVGKLVSEAPTYVRINGGTAEAAPPGATFGGLSDQGRYLFYAHGGDLFRFDVVTEATVPVGSGGQSVFVNVPADGTRAYFSSTVVLTGGEENEQGAKAAAGQPNLYVWDAASDQVRFIATVDEEDIIGEPPPFGGEPTLIGGLGLWTSDAVAADQSLVRGPANDPSRSDAAGGVLAFESRANLTGYDSKGFTEVYRYELATGKLDCISCSPVGAPPSSPAHLESRYAARLHSVPPLNAVSLIDNVAAGGKRIFFESGDSLSFEDTDGTSDVYGWEEQGFGGCQVPAGCIGLISSGRSAFANYLFGVSGDGRDVFFWSGDELTAEDTSDTPSIYDARIGGGFAAPVGDVPCRGEACQGGFAPAPSLPAPISSAVTAGNLRPHHGHHAKRKGHHRKHHRKHHRHHRRHRTGEGRR
jgi:hypothetical protein